MQWREPSELTQGDTIGFTRRLPLYPATDGWSLLYALRGNGQDIEFVSSPDSSDHAVEVASSITELWLPAEYQLEGWATKTDGTRKQIYLGSLLIRPDLATAAPDIDVRTHAQKMLQSIEEQLELCAKNILLDTTVEGTRVLREKRLELLQMRQKYIQERRGEVARENAKNGKPTGRKIKTVLSIMPPGSTAATQFGAGNSVFNYPFA